MINTLLRLSCLTLIIGWTINAAYAFEEDSLVVRKCIHCHAYDNGKLARISDLRTTPEEWTVIIDRMHRLHKMPLSASDMGDLLKGLCATQMLTPREADRVAYINLFNNPQTMETPANPDEEKLFTACVRCHSAAKIRSYRMSPAAWKKLRDFHLYMDPAIMYQMREMHWREEADKVLEWLGKEQPYQADWTAPQASPAGKWLVLGYEPGKGNYRGEASIVAQGDDEYTLAGTLDYTDGTSENFNGSATLYGGYALRTRTRHNGAATLGAYSFVDGTIRGEHQHEAPDFRTSSATWYPLNGESRVLRTTPAYLLSGEPTHVVVEGLDLPGIREKDVTVGNPDVEVLEVVSATPAAIELVLRYKGRAAAATTLHLKNLDAGRLTLAPRIDYLRVTPATGRARVNGGVHYPAEGVQFEAIAWSSGADADDPADDLVLGPVPALFSLEEDATRPDDDDLMHLGAIESDGTYIPTGDYDSIPSRRYEIEGTGMVKVVAAYTRGNDHYSAAARLVVTVPDYIQRVR